MVICQRLACVLAATLMASGAAAQTPSSPPTSPLAVHLGDTDLRLGGFIDAVALFRSTNVGSGPATTFGTIPFENTPAGALSETRFSAQSSRANLLVTTALGGAAVKAFLEVDFLGSGPGNAFVYSNSHTLRLRHAWAQYVRGRFDFTGGQTWTLLTLNRNGLSPVSADVITSQNLDPNLQLGMAWARQMQFRFVAHASKTVAAGISLENPQPFVGSAVVLPSSFPAGEVDAGSTPGAPSPYPDIVGKIAFDPQVGGRHEHVEAGFIVRGFRTYAPASQQTFSATGTGFTAGAVLEPAKNVRVIASTLISSGGGRYMIGQAPDFMVNADASLTTIGATSGLLGVEAQVVPSTLVFGYYGTVHVDRVTSLDGTTPIGYGIDGSTAANHTIDETTVGVNHAIVRDATRGALQAIVQYSYLTRSPWSVPAATPDSAHVNMVYVSVRYVLP
ncbi:MAG TPA: hypothetical protein VGI12_11015 [Vicinamibacterales bacterium]|jgi:hypothetical protein